MSSSATAANNYDLEIDISDCELSDIMIMPLISPSQTLSLITMAPTELTAAILSEPGAGITKPAKAPRKPRISKNTKTAQSTELANSANSPINNNNTISGSSSISKLSTPSKSVAAEQQFTIGLTRECFTEQELAINPLTQIFIENSRVSNNNELIKYQAVRAGILDYKCYGKGCPTKDGNWRRKLGFLILVRNNNRETDLRITNLSFLCPNCYCQEKGLQSFEKVKKEIIRTCTFCSAPLDGKYNSNKCGRCAWQIKTQIQKSSNMDRLSRTYGQEIDGLSASNMAILMNSSILDEGLPGGSGFVARDTHKYSGTAAVSSSARYHNKQTVNPTALRIENSGALKRLFMELSEQQ